MLWPSVTKGDSITDACLCLGTKLAFIPKAFQVFFCGFQSSGQSSLPSPLPGCVFLMLPPHRSHPLGSSQETARGAHLLPFPPSLLAVCLLDSGAGSGEELAEREWGEKREAGTSLVCPRSAQPVWGGSSAGQVWFCFFEAAQIPARNKYRGIQKTPIKWQMSLFPLSAEVLAGLLSPSFWSKTFLAASGSYIFLMISI